MRKSWIFAMGLALAVPAMASAQTGRVSLEGRGGLAFPQGDLSDLGANSGFAAALDLMYSFNPWFSGYAGVSRDEFDGGFSSNGFQVGAKLIPTVDGNVTPWFALGVLSHELRANGDDSGMELGVDAGGGADFALTQRFSLTPALRYRSYDAGVPLGNMEARYFQLTLGAHLHLR